MVGLIEINKLNLKKNYRHLKKNDATSKSTTKSREGEHSSPHGEDVIQARCLQLLAARMRSVPSEARFGQHVLLKADHLR